MFARSVQVHIQIALKHIYLVYNMYVSYFVNMNAIMCDVSRLDCFCLECQRWS